MRCIEIDLDFWELYVFPLSHLCTVFPLMIIGVLVMGAGAVRGGLVKARFFSLSRSYFALSGSAPVKPDER